MRKIIWHYMRHEDLGSWESRSACGLNTIRAGVATSDKAGVTCKNCLIKMERGKKK